MKKMLINLVVNLSSNPLTSYQRSVLAMGMSYCTTPGEPDKGELREDLNRFHRDLRRKAFGGNKNKNQSIPTESNSSDDALNEVVYDCGLAL